MKEFWGDLPPISVLAQIPPSPEPNCTLVQACVADIMASAKVPTSLGAAVLADPAATSMIYNGK
jgi:hypothetical protein